MASNSLFMAVAVGLAQDWVYSTPSISYHGQIDW